jgi:hypothetical protein
VRAPGCGSRSGEDHSEHTFLTHTRYPACLTTAWCCHSPNKRSEAGLRAFAMAEADAAEAVSLCAQSERPYYTMVLAMVHAHDKRLTVPRGDGATPRFVRICISTGCNIRGCKRMTPSPCATSSRTLIGMGSTTSQTVGCHPTRAGIYARAGVHIGPPLTPHLAHRPRETARRPRKESSLVVAAQCGARGAPERGAGSARNSARGEPDHPAGPNARGQDPGRAPEERESGDKCHYHVVAVSNGLIASLCGQRAILAGAAEIEGEVRTDSAARPKYVPVFPSFLWNRATWGTHG